MRRPIQILLATIAAALLSAQTIVLTLDPGAPASTGMVTQKTYIPSHARMIYTYFPDTDTTRGFLHSIGDQWTVSINGGGATNTWFVSVADYSAAFVGQTFTITQPVDEPDLGIIAD